MPSILKATYRGHPTRETLTFGDANSGPGIPALKVYVNGIERAFLTPGCRTVTMTNPALPRTFVEHKKVGLQYRDDFSNRVRKTPTTSGRGTSPYFGSWSRTSGGLITSDVVDGGTATTTVNEGGSSWYRTLRDPFKSEDVARRFRLKSTSGLDSSLSGIVGGYVSTGDNNRTDTRFNTSGNLTQLISERTGGASEVIYAQKSNAITGYAVGDWLRDRRKRVGNGLMYELWRDGDPYSSASQITVDNVGHTVGRVGERLFNSTNNTNAVYEIDWFDILAGDWEYPPTVTHAQYVRLLPTPFTSWTSEVEELVRKWLTDTTPDILAYWMMFCPGGVAVNDPALLTTPPSGIAKQVFGESKYGPDTSLGARAEGADWNDYIRITGQYPYLTTPTTDPPETAEQYALDCSGTTRMIWGRLGGIEMCLSTPADFNGFRLPRRAVDMINYGPGLKIAHSVGSAVDMTYLRVGDHIGFNADPSDDTGSGEDDNDLRENDDHIGTYLGVSTDGNLIFLSSRKTSNGPGFGMVGGPSQLNGTGFWARATRDIRRF